MTMVAILRVLLKVGYLLTGCAIISFRSRPLLHGISEDYFTRVHDVSVICSNPGEVIISHYTDTVLVCFYFHTKVTDRQTDPTSQTCSIPLRIQNDVFIIGCEINAKGRTVVTSVHINEKIDWCNRNQSND